MRRIPLPLKSAFIIVALCTRLSAYDVAWDVLNAVMQTIQAIFGGGPGGDMPNSCGSPLQVASGNFIQSIPILKIPGRGPAINIALTYHSFDARRGPFGRGWTVTYDQRVIETTNGVQVSAVCAGPTGFRNTYARNADGSYTPPPYVHDLLTKNSDGSFVLRDKNGGIRNFSANGRLASIVDRNGNALALTYDSTNFPTMITDAGGRTVTLTKGGDGRVAILTDPANRQFKFSYDSNGDLIKIADPLGNTTTLQYNVNGYLTSLADPKGNTLLTASYNSDNTVASYKQRGETWTVAYDSSNQKTSETDSSYNTWVHYYNSSGSITKNTDPLGNSESFVYDANFNVVQYTDKNGNATKTTFDASANPLTLQDALGNTVSITYDPVFNLPLTVKDRLGNTTIFTYDSKGNLTKVTDPLGNATAYQYDPKGQLTSITDAAGNTSTLAYDAYGNVVKRTDPLGHASTAAFDILGGITSAADANGKTTQFTYDGDHRVIKTVDSAGGQTLYQFDASGDLTSLMIPGGAATTFQYDNLNRFTMSTNPLGNTTQYTYDAKDNVASKTDAGGNTLYYFYDALSRLSSKLGGNGGNYTYDKAGNLTRLANAGAGLTYVYDALNRVVQAKTDASSQPATAITYTYDANGHRTTMVDPAGGTTTYGYDAAGHLISVHDPSSQTWTFAFDKISRRIGLTGPAGINNTYAWDATNHLTALNDQATAGSLSFSYTYDPVGNVTSRTDAAGNNVYTYDSLNRLTGATHPAGQSVESYSYDPVGNRTASSLSATYTTDAANRLNADATFNYTYSASGNLTKKTERATGNVTSYSYNGDNQLTAISTPKFDSYYYNYDGLGRRIQKTINGATTQYVYDGPNIIAEYGNTGSVSATYVHGPGIDELLSVKRSGTTSYFQTDALGTVIQTVSSSGVNSSYKYDSYGRILSQTGTPQAAYAFTGREYDSESGLYYYTARYYDSGIGRFLSEDPIGFAGGRNVYMYVNGNPTSLVDPLGLCPPNWKNIGLIAGTAVIAAAIVLAPEILAAEGLFAAASADETIALVAEEATEITAEGDGLVAGSIADVNPSGSLMNCVNCSIATDSTLAGNAASALPGSPTSITVLEDAYGGQFQPVSGPMQIGSILSESGNGSRGIVFGESLTQGEPGHVFNVINNGGNIQFLDGQIGGNGIGNFDVLKNFQFLLTHAGTP